MNTRCAFKRLSLSTVLKDVRFETTVPGPGDRLPDCDRSTVSGGRFRPADLATQDQRRRTVTEAQIFEAAFTITTYIAIGKSGDALGDTLEDVFVDTKSLLHLNH